MRKLGLLICLLATTVLSQSQDLTNKGKDFWLGYGDHVRMHGTGNNTQEMVIYVTSEQTTSFRVEIPGTGWVYNGTVNANAVATTVPIPKSGIQDARLNQEGKFNRGIHLTSDKPIVAYMHIYNMNVSGAGILFPTNTLGREYVSINYTQASNEANAFSFFFVIATEDNTVVEITPSQSTLGGRSANLVFTETLNKGEVYNVLSNGDLTGSRIRSVASATASCKRIAVFSGSGKISIPGQGSGDNFIQQAFPGSAWGKKYITTPTRSQTFNFFRIVKKDPATVVRLDGGVILPASFVNGVYYEFGATNEPHVIEASDAVMVAQYTTSQGDWGNPNTAGDPEMIYLSPIEQTVNHAILNSTPNFSISGHYVNVVMKTGTTSSFKIDGINLGSSFVPIPTDPSYSWLSTQVSQGNHTLSADSAGFNAIAYGFGNAESYGYSAGTNLRDLYQYITISNDYATVNFPAGCKGSPFKFSMTFPYQPTSISWQFGGLFPDTSINNPVFDSTWIENGKTLYRYRLNRIYSTNSVGTFPIIVLANNPTADGCNGLQEIEYELQIFERPSADFNFVHSGCVSDSVAFTAITNGQGRPIIHWNWDFGDGGKSPLASPKYKYAAAGQKLVRFSSITDIGCLSDTVSKLVTISDPPVAKFGASAPYCEKSTITFSDSSTVPTGTIVRWSWNLGDNTVINAVDGNPVQHVYNTAGTYMVTLQVETNTGCRSTLFTKNIVIHPKPVAAFSFNQACLPNAFIQFTNQSSISDGSQALLNYTWDFGDNGVSALPDPIRQYLSTGPFNVRLLATSNNGCTDDSIRVMATVYAQPRIQVTSPAEKCLGDSVRIAVRINNPAGLKISAFTLNWSDGSPATVGTLNAPADSVVIYHVFTTAGAQNATVFVRGDAPGGCLSDTLTVPVYINSLPVANYNISAIACKGETIHFTDLSTVGDGVINNWAWVLGNGNVSVLQNPSTTYLDPGTYNSSLLVQSSKGCISTLATRPVVVNHKPAANFGTPEVCLSDPFAQFTDSSTIGDNSESQFTYFWNFGDPNSNAGNPNTSSSKNPQHRYNSVGHYTIGLTVTSKDGCINALTKIFTVNGSIPVASYAVNNANALCSNQDVTIKDASTVDFGTIVKVEVYWDYGNDPTIKTVDDEPTPGKLYSHKYPEFGSPATRSYSVRYVAYSGINCVHEFTRTVVVNASPSVQFNALNLVCEEITPFPLNAASEVFGFNGTGIYSGTGIISANGVFNPAAAKPGVHTIRYTFTASNGCSTFAEQSIRVAATPTIDAGPDRVVLEGGFIVLQAKASGDNLSYSWTPVAGLDNARLVTPKVSPSEDTYYQLKVVSKDGCEAQDEVFVKLLKKPKVPNAFSPNGDGINDTWIIEHLDSYPDVTVEVFNRYGQLVYQSKGYGRGWNGTMNGNPLPAGTYYWIINPRSGREPMNGSVTIIR